MSKPRPLALEERRWWLPA